MAGDLKQAFIEAVRTTPEGIVGFLETPIPAAPSIATPGDVDAAIIANGVCAKYICDFFAAFGGLTPIELLLRIGQHNNVLESAMLAGLEYIEGSDSDEDDLRILSPVAEQTYPAGEIAFGAEAVNGECSGIYVSVGPHQSKQLIGGNIMLTLGAEGTYTAVFTGVFDDGPVTQSVTFYVTEDGAPPDPPDSPPDPPPDPPDPPDKKKKDKMKRARENVMASYTKLIRACNEESVVDAEIYANSFKGAVNAFLQAAETSSSMIEAAMTQLNLALIGLLLPGWASWQDVITTSSDIMNEVNAIYSGV